MAKKQINELDVMSALRPDDIIFARDDSDSVDKQFTVPDHHPLAAEYDTFTPVLTAATPGDLGVSYSAQSGEFWRRGDRVDFRIDLDCTPTFSTATGTIIVTGLPYAAQVVPAPVYECQLSNFTTWGGSATTRFMSKAYTPPAGPSTIQLFADGPGLTSAVFSMADLTSGNAILLRVYGFYRTAAAFA